MVKSLRRCLACPLSPPSPSQNYTGHEKPGPRKIPSHLGMRVAHPRLIERARAVQFQARRKRGPRVPEPRASACLDDGRSSEEADSNLIPGTLIKSLGEWCVGRFVNHFAIPTGSCWNHAVRGLSARVRHGLSLSLATWIYSKSLYFYHLPLLQPWAWERF